MPVWKKMLIAALGALTLGGAANVVAFAAGDDPPRPGAVDVKGPCDEAEHAGEARCAGPQVLEDRDGDEREGEADERQDDGDEAEDHRRGHDEGQEDNSGPSENSGHGGDSDASDNSGPSENAGSGGGDNSGPGSSGSGHGED